MCWMEVCKYVLVCVSVCAQFPYWILPTTPSFPFLISSNTSMASQFKNPVQKLTAFLPSKQLSILNRSLPTWFPPTPCGVKHASNLTHDDHSVKWGVVDTLQIVESVPLWEQVLSKEKFFMRHHHMVTIWQRCNRKFSPDASNAMLPSAILDRVLLLTLSAWLAAFPAVGSVGSLWRLSGIYAYISFGICCIFETLNEGEMKTYSDTVLFPWGGGESKWIISLEKLFLSRQFSWSIWVFAFTGARQAW